MQALEGRNTPKISVVIPTYNTAGLIGGCLDSVLAQTLQDFEVIVVNDGSPDTVELEKVLKPYLARIVYIRQENKRVGGARNTAITRALGEYLAFLDSDDSWFPDHLTSQMELFAEDPALDMVYGNGLVVGNPVEGYEFMERCPSNGAVDFEALVEERCQIPISTVVVRKSCVASSGLFDESLPRCEDYDMWLRVAYDGAKIGYSRKVLARLNAGRPGSLGETRVKMAEAYWNILEKAERTLPLNAEEHKLVRKRSANIRARYLCEEGKQRLVEQQFEAATERFSEANRHWKNPTVAVVLSGLRIAPHITRKSVSWWSRFRSKRRSGKYPGETAQPHAS